jgi:hypothetical protein
MNDRYAEQLVEAVQRLCGEGYPPKGIAELVARLREIHHELARIADALEAQNTRGTE